MACLRKIAIVLACLACLAALFLVRDFFPDNEGNHDKGKQVVEALKKYKNDHGSYPATLEDLVPDYLPALPRLDGKAKWFYRFRDGGEISLAYGGGPSTWSGVYRSKYDDWIIDTK